jgi:uncharacterized damage-inducible protein DinB
MTKSWTRGVAAAVALATAATWTASASAGVKDEMMMWLRDADGKLVQLAEAMPDGKYSWRPGKGVRSVGEVFMHVAAANYGLPGFAGITPPAGFKFDTFEGSKTTKADIVQTLKDSIAHMEGGLAKMSDADMERPAEFFGIKTTARGAYMLLLSHAHEHLGQAIAYARSNEVTPPWSERTQAPAKETKY